jgi:hypothetical protein
MRNIKRALFRLIAMIPGAVWLKRRIFGRRAIPPVPVTRPCDREAPPVRKSSVGASNVFSLDESFSFVLYRIIGNDLVPRHRKGQSRENLQFILDNEPELNGCEKRFVVNRIVDPEEESAIIQLLENAGVEYIHIPFNSAAYREISWDIVGVPPEYSLHTERYAQLNEAQQGRILARLYRYKNNYVIHNNGARNIALEDGRQRADWVLPWDGNCFMTQAGWDELTVAIRQAPETPYWIVPMARVIDNDALLLDEYRPQATEEPQVVFRADTELAFDPEYFYGRRPKVELFWRLGVPGKWDDWPIEPWDLPCPPYSSQAGCFARAGWVARLFSGQEELEQDRDGRALVDRGLARVEAVRDLLDCLDESVHGARFAHDKPVFVDLEKQNTIPESLHTALSQAADKALQRGPHSVVHKQSLPPSGNRHDYWHPAPYYWPHPLRIPGLPYVRRDGRRMPGTRLHEPMSENYDRSRLQHLFDDTYVLTLASHYCGNAEYARYAAELVCTWFLDPETAMNPHLEYAQVRRGHDGNRGSSSGIIEFKDFYYFLDAVRLLTAGGYLSNENDRSFREWLCKYLEWLQDSEQGKQERASNNNHGTYYDLQVASIAAFLGDYKLLRNTLRDSRFRIVEQFESDGYQPHEMTRTTTAHYCCFNLQGWIHLAQLAASVGDDLWHFEGPQGQGLHQSMKWLLQHMGKAWPYQQIDEFDHDRFLPIYFTYVEQYEDGGEIDALQLPGKTQVKPVFFPHDGIRPFWQIDGNS